MPPSVALSPPLHAEELYHRNRDALHATGQASPEPIALDEIIPTADGTMMIRSIDPCTVPRRAAELAFRKLELQGSTACLLKPTHAAQLRATLERAMPSLVLLAIQPDAMAANALLACDDFAAEIAAGRLRLVFGPAWSRSLEALLDREPGISIPRQFVRLPWDELDTLEPIITEAQHVFARVALRQQEALALIVQNDVAGEHPLVLTGSTFELWNDAPTALSRALDSAATRVDLHAAGNAGLLRMGTIALRASSIVSADTGRSDYPSFVSPAKPWLSLATRRVPRYDPAAPRDQLAIVSANLRLEAREAGWPEDRIIMTACPARACATRGPLIMCYDFPSIEVPESLEDLSSHRLLWDHLEHELTCHPLADREPLEATMSRLMRSLQIDAESFPTRLVIERLVQPTLAKNVALQLLRCGESLEIWGRGWGEIEGVRGEWRGSIESEAHFDSTLARGKLLDVWPGERLHPAHRIANAIDVWQFGRSLRPRQVTPEPAGQSLRDAVADISRAI